MEGPFRKNEKARTEVGRLVSLHFLKIKENNMFRAFGAALTLALLLLVLRWVVPEIADLLILIVTKILLIISNVIDQVGHQL